MLSAYKGFGEPALGLLKMVNFYLKSRQLLALLLIGSWKSMNYIGMKGLAALVVTLGLAGCATVPYEQLKLDTISNFKAPAPEKAGIYVYQWKSGVLGAGMDVNFEIKGQPKIALNTGEYGYIELPAGNYEYKLRGGLSQLFIPVKFEAGQNYFFRAALVSFSDLAILIRDQVEIDDAKKNIISGRYEWHTID